MADRGQDDISPVDLQARAQRRKTKYLFVTDLDLDGQVSALLFQLLHRVPDEDITWRFAGAGRRLEPEWSGQEVYHFDTGLRFDGWRDFDHHGDPGLADECAASLVLKSYPHLDEHSDVEEIRELVEFVNLVEHAGYGGLRRREWSLGIERYIRAMTSLIKLRIKDVSLGEKLRACRLLFKAWYAEVVSEREDLKELGLGNSIRFLRTPAGIVAIGAASRILSKTLRSRIRQLRRKGRRVDFLICRYPDNFNTDVLGSEESGSKASRIGITKLFTDEDSLDMLSVAEKVHELFPQTPVPATREQIQELSELYRLLEQAVTDSNAEAVQKIDQKIAALRLQIPKDPYVDYRNFVVYWHVPDDVLAPQDILRALLAVVKHDFVRSEPTFPLPIVEEYQEPVSIGREPIPDEEEISESRVAFRQRLDEIRRSLNK
jgi:hypothetical protein